MKLAGICFLFALQLTRAPLEGQPAAATTPETGSLRIVVVEGEALIHNLRQAATSQIVLRVESEDKPVAGASVALSFPAQGASGTFVNHAMASTVMTDARGTAVIRGLRPNQIAGKLEIRTTASYRGQTAGATITQFNIVVPSVARKSGNSKIIIILAAVGAAAAGGAYAGLHKNTSSPGAPATQPSIPSIGITPGTGAVGSP